MSHLVLASHNFAPARGGIQRLADGLARHVAPGITTVLTERDSTAADHDRQAPYDVVRRRLVADVPPRWRPAKGALRDVVDATRADAVLALEWWPEGRALASLRRSRRSSATTAVVVHGTDVAAALADGRARRSARAALRNVGVVIAVSHYTAALVHELGIDATVIHPGVDVASAPDRPDVADRYGLRGRPIVLTTARLVARKGHLAFMPHWENVAAAVPGALWVVAGDGPEAAAIRRVAPPSVRMLGPVDDDDLRALYALATVHLLPGRQIDANVEGFGMAAVEAGAAGTPTVATDLGGTAEAVGAGGVVVPAERLDLAADAVVDLLRDGTARTRLGRAARARAEELAWPLVGRRYRTALGLEPATAPSVAVAS